MATRPEDWYRQAAHDLAHARRSLEGEDYGWACFAAQQAAEKALKALYQKLGKEAWGHSVFRLLQDLPAEVSAATTLLEHGKGLDKHYIPARYPNAYPGGAPYEYYTRSEAERAVAQADSIIRFCKGFLD